MDKLDQAGAFKFPEVSEGLKKLLNSQEKNNRLLEENNRLLEEVVESKLDQKISDNTKHDAWKKQKDQSTILSLVAIFIAGLALTVTTDVNVVAGAIDLFNSFVDLFG